MFYLCFCCSDAYPYFFYSAYPDQPSGYTYPVPGPLDPDTHGYFDAYAN